MNTTPSSSTPFAISTSTSTGRILYSDNYVLPSSTTTYTFPQHEVYLVKTECKPIENHIAKVKGYASENLDLLVCALVLILVVYSKDRIY